MCIFKASTGEAEEIPGLVLSPTRLHGFQCGHYTMVIHKEATQLAWAQQLDGFDAAEGSLEAVHSLTIC